MSEFLAEAQVLVRPNTDAFRAALVAQLATATKGVVVPITVAPVTGTAAAATGFARLTQVQNDLRRSTEQNAGKLDELNKRLPKTTSALLGAGSATAKLDAGLLGLRTAIGSSAVIGLSALALAAIVAGKAVSASIRNFAAFQQELATFRAIAGATAEQMKAVSDQANRLGADIRLPAVSAADAAIAMTELAKAGLSVEEAMAGAEGVLQLATAAQISNADAALIAASALNSFGLAGEQAEEVADTLANAANAAQGSISDFGLALRQSSAVARQVGLSLQDTTAILSLFAKNGLQGSDAGTSLRVALIRLVAPTKKAAAEIQKLGLNIRDASGNVRADVFAQFGEATRNLSPALRDASAALIFGQDAIRAVSIGAREGTDGLRLMQFEIDQTGTAAEVAAARTEGLAGKFSALQSTAETLSIRLGKIASPLLSEVIDQMLAAADAAVKLGDAFGQVQSFLPAGVSKDAETFRDTVASLGKRGLGPLAGFTLTAKAALDIYNRTVTTSEERTAKLNEELQALQTARIAAEEGGQRGIADQLTKEINALRDEIKALEDAGKGIDSGVTAPLKRALAEAEKARDIKISVGADTTSLDRLIASLKETIPITQHVEGNIQRLRDDFVNLGDAGRNSAGGVDALTKALADLGRQAGAAQAELLRLQTEGGTPQQQIAVLGGLRKTQEEIIAKIKEDGNQAGDASAITEARNKILSFDSQIESLQNELAADAKALATAAEKAQKERQDAFERVLAAQLLPKERLLARAGGTEGVGDDIKFREVIIKILKGQIDQIRKTLGNTLEARKLIGAIQDRILSEVLKLKADQRTFRQNLRAALEEKLENAQRGTELDIELADINENTKRRIALRQRLIAQLKKEAKVLHLQGNALKENRNERARIRAEIEAILKEEKGGEDTRKKAAEFFFEQLQAQQGFAANLLGNLITGPTAGLVGVPSPSAPRPQTGLRGEANRAEGRANLGPTAGQHNTEISVLEKILMQLRILNGSYDAPEAINQKKTGASSMDYAAM